ncbi:glycosyltransferase family 2 protein [Planotetraspora kaengkrachanensis]|uniref:Glycosyl transferase family 2 n=1 Tax=Planotetraspora kaengkrachanensis TaxID=575193 RepID=A0A8J3LVB3_9ACTN|nr:glycosyltransferase family 2 protein [Planotetraspora kaengkrachanensis]GIG78449.1 glycosyl transferase family 2 [Planotetraspora kaengkrachanensis]
MSGTPRIAIVIVTYNSARVLEGCLSSLLPGARGVDLAEVVVADNASKDDSVLMADKAGATVVQLGRNAGYAAAINAGIASLDLDGLDAVLVLNPDCRLGEGSLARLAEPLRRPRTGITAPRLTSPDGHVHPSLRRAPTVRGAWAEAVIGGTLAGRLGSLGEVITDPERYDQPGPAAWATGAAMLISVPALREIGPWDESFLLYSEETEFALRAADLGWTLWYEPAAVVEHIGGDAKVNPMLAALLTVNKVRLFRRRRGPLAGFAYYLAVLLGEGVRAVAGRSTARAAVLWLVMPSRRIRALPGG